MFALIYNGSIEVGPRDWYFPIFYAFLVDADLLDEATTLPRSAPTTILTGTNWTILPASIATPPSIQKFEQHSGPTWTITDTEVTGTYTVVDMPLNTAKNILRAKLKEVRTAAENATIPLSINDVLVQIPADRESRMIFTTATSGALWKFTQARSVVQSNVNQGIIGQLFFPSTIAAGDIWLTLTDNMITLIKSVTTTYVQDCFNWEARVAGTIATATSLDDLRAIDLTFVPSQTHAVA